MASQQKESIAVERLISRALADSSEKSGATWRVRCKEKYKREPQSSILTVKIPKPSSPSFFPLHHAAALLLLIWLHHSSLSWMSVAGLPPVFLPVVQLLKEVLLNHCTVPGYYRAIHACKAPNSQVLSLALACTKWFTTWNDEHILLVKHSLPQIKPSNNLFYLLWGYVSEHSPL